ncbi:MAG: RNA polymerase sigma factor [Ruminococcus bicirculans (ex Wegman et al. 2014)]|uniref:RNA polymerase sigma factor n=1 Tax=Clostridia TaxID=186801 RepID=UPI000AF4AC92|nr:sigma-70 family RNA polymerase sigma factor [Ruminococcus bicirculans (ex Wegman et al. 2014)]MCC2216719.1 sigma-70 region 4 domain-containing protein [Hominimerdicola aceti]MCC3658273.1 sigma-70 region 4 domain-containing protein [Ruminococcus albus]
MIDNENDNAILRLAIKKLPQDYMDVIHLYYTKDLSAKEISDLLDISNTNVY